MVRAEAVKAKLRSQLSGVDSLRAQLVQNGHGANGFGGRMLAFGRLLDHGEDAALGAPAHAGYGAAPIDMLQHQDGNNEIEGAA